MCIQLYTHDNHSGIGGTPVGMHIINRTMLRLNTLNFSSKYHSRCFKVFLTLKSNTVCTMNQLTSVLLTFYINMINTIRKNSYTVFKNKNLIIF